MAEATIFIAFLAGLVSFLSPCVLPLIPAFMSYLAGTTSADIQKGSTQVKSKTIINTFLFVLGFSSVFSILGVILNSILIDISVEVTVWLGRIGGIIIIFFGLYLLGLIKPAFLEREHKLKAKKFKSSYLTSFVFGAAFAAGWSPCVGAILGTILTLAATNQGGAFAMLFAYSLGLGIPFILAGIFTGSASHLIEKAGPWLKYFNIVMGIFLLLLGVLVFTGRLALIANFIPVAAIFNL